MRHTISSPCVSTATTSEDVVGRGSCFITPGAWASASPERSLPALPKSRSTAAWPCASARSRTVVPSMGAILRLSRSRPPRSEARNRDRRDHGQRDRADRERRDAERLECVAAEERERGAEEPGGQVVEAEEPPALARRGAVHERGRRRDAGE